MNKKQVLLTSAIALALTLACTIFVGGPDYPQPPIPISPEAITSLQEEVKAAALAGAASGEITLKMSETQLTS